MINVPALQVSRLKTKPFGSNTYCVWFTGRPSTLVIDPGAGSSGWIAERMIETGGKVDHVLLTHEHFDHIADLSLVKQHWQCSVICSEICSSAAGDPTRNFSRYLVQCDITCEPADFFCEAMDWNLQWNDLELRFIPTPGHSPGSICIAIAGVLFTGDTLLPEGKRVSRVPGGNKKDLETSIALICSKFLPSTLVFPGHGEPFHLCELGNPSQRQLLEEAI